MTKDYDFEADFMLGGVKTSSVTMIGKIVLMPTNKKIGDAVMIALFGAAISENNAVVLPENSGFHEMWECEITIKPIRKYSAHSKNDKNGSPSYRYHGYRVDQVLESDFGNSDNWGELYFGKENRFKKQED